MPIKIPAHLPGRATLEREGVCVITEDRAQSQDIRPLRFALMNLMPDKITTETQLLRAIGNTSLQAEITLLHAGSHVSRNTPSAHLDAFYQTVDDVADQYFDGLIVTGAPVEKLPFAEVDYWPELQRTFNWAAKNVYSSLFICWGAQAALHHYHDTPKEILPQKLSGVYPHHVLRQNAITQGFDDLFNVPVSRHTTVSREDITRVSGLHILAESPVAGPCLLHEPEARRVYMFNHLEYDADTLKREYERDLSAALGPAVPFGYFPGDDPAATPVVTWRAHRNLLFHNWINAVYQGTPYKLEELAKNHGTPPPSYACAHAPRPPAF